MSDPNDGGNKTVFRPSPLQGRKSGTTQIPGQFPGQASPRQSSVPPGNPIPSAVPPHSPQAPVWAGRGAVPPSANASGARDAMLAEAAPALAIAAAMRSDQGRTPLPHFHQQATHAITAFDRAIAAHYPDETRQRARYAVCATIDDVARNLPGAGEDAAEWGRRSMVTQSFGEAIGDERFWQLVDESLRDPVRNREPVALLHACLVAGFEGRFRDMPDGRARLHEMMGRLDAGLAHGRPAAVVETPAPAAQKAPRGRIGSRAYVAIAAAVAGALLLAYLAYRMWPL